MVLPFANPRMRGVYFVLKNVGERPLNVNTFLGEPDLLSWHVVGADGRDQVVVRIATQAGWTMPGPSDLWLVKPGEKVHVTGLAMDLCDNPGVRPGSYRTYVVYRNAYGGRTLRLRDVWEGRIASPAVRFEVDGPVACPEGAHPR